MLHFRVTAILTVTINVLECWYPTAFQTFALIRYLIIVCGYLSLLILLRASMNRVDSPIKPPYANKLYVLWDFIDLSSFR